MKLKTEVVDEKQKILIVSKEKLSFIDNLKNQLKKYSVEIFFSPKEPKSLNIFNYVFFINHHFSLEKIKEENKIKFVFIFINKKAPKYLVDNQKNNLKVIQSKSKYLTSLDIDKILWFIFSQSQENFLKINPLIEKKENFEEKKINFKLIYFLTKKNLFLLIIISFILSQIIFLPFALTSSFFIYQSFKNLKNENYKNINNYLIIAEKLNNNSIKLYKISQPTLRLFGVASIFENFLDINKYAVESIKNINVVINEGKIIQELIFNKNKSIEEKQILKTKLENFNFIFDKLTNNLNVISQKLDFPFQSIKSLKNQLVETSDLLSKSKILINYFEKVLSQKNLSKYLIFFANNMELRPGGGFIGSFAILEIQDYQVNLKVYDVYDADGQLKAHIDPPKPLSLYLNLPHWYLRDSNFSPDFIENYQKALFFLNEEMSFKDFNGGILLTTTAVENILKAFGNIYIPDFKETINAENFYLKTQLNVEKDFFPGSRKKQVFLSKIVENLIINLNYASFKKLAYFIKKSLDEKQIVGYFDDQLIQSFFDSSYWSGRLISPQCLIQKDNCFADYIFPYDANLGANKANFFINKSMYFKTLIDNKNQIIHQLTINYENTSPSEVFPTGYYRNYFQILIPKNSFIKTITKNGILINEYDEKDSLEFKQIGFFFEIPPKKKVEIKINYQLEEKLKKGRSIYQLVFQKQIGTLNSDLILEYQINKNVSVINQNFSPLVKNNTIIYNTNLTTDKIFFIELIN